MFTDMIDWRPVVRRLTESLVALSCMSRLSGGGSFHLQRLILDLDMCKSKLALLSIVCGIFITAALTGAAFLFDNEYVSGALLWQITLIVYLIGRGPILGYDE